MNLPLSSFFIVCVLIIVLLIVMNMPTKSLGYTTPNRSFGYTTPTYYGPTIRPCINDPASGHICPRPQPPIRPCIHGISGPAGCQNTPPIPSDPPIPNIFTERA